MYLLDWSNLQPSSADWHKAIHQTSGVFHVRVLLLKLVESLLSTPTWENRSDTVTLFDPSTKYKQDQYIALLRRDPQSVHPDSWRIGKVKKVEDTSNPLQGSFQVVSVSVDGKEEAYASGITGAQPLSFQLPTGPEEREMLAAEFVDAFLEALKKNLQDAVEEGLISAEINGDEVLIGDSAFIGEIEREFIGLFFSELPQEQPYLTTEDIYLRLRELDALSDIPKDGALFSLRLCLEEMGFKSLGNNQWISPDAFTKLNREVKRYLPVPRIRTRVQDDENIELPGDFEVFVKDLGEEEPAQPEEPTAHWQPPAQPLAIGYLSFLNLREGYFPLADIDKAFPPELDHMLVNVQIVEGSNLFSFLVDRQNGVLKLVNPTAFRDKLTGLGIWAGVRLWLAYQSEGMYRIYPKPLAQPREITCKQIWLDDEGNLQAEVIPIELQYEADEHIFKADLRLMDPEALEAQAQQSNRSIFDCMRKAFPVLAALDSQGRVHYKDLFQMVFFQDRMCSPRTVISNLYSYECFSPVGHGLFTFDPSRGPHRRHAPRRTVRVVQPRVSVARPGLTEEYEPWITISQLVGQELQTLKQREPFTVLDLNDTAVLIRTSTGKTRSIDRYRIDRAWNHLLTNGELSRAEIQKNFSNFNPAYVAAILSRVPSVSVSSTSPITLTIAKAAPLQEIPLDENILFKQLEACFPQIEKIVSCYLLEKFSPRPENIMGRVTSIERHVALFFRADAHKRIRNLLSKENIALLTEEEFNKNVWQDGSTFDHTGESFKFQHQNYLLETVLTFDDSPGSNVFQASDVINYLIRNGVTTTGNQTWGSASNVWGPMLKLASEKREATLRLALQDLIYGPGSSIERLARITQSGIGLGMNSATGILHVMFPQEEILFNERSLAALRKLTFDLPEDWRIDVDNYVLYREFCQEFRDIFGFSSLTDVDYFFYLVSEDEIIEPYLVEAEQVVTPISKTVVEQVTPDVALPLPEKSAAEPVSAEVKSEESPLSTLERMRSGQLIAPDLLPKPPLLETFVHETETPEIIKTAAQEAQPAAHAVDVHQHPPTVEPVVTIPNSLDQESIPPTPPAAEPLPELSTWVAPTQAARRSNQNKKLPDQTREDMQNKTLFSRHYLDQRLPNLDEWKEDPLPFIEQIRVLWKKAAQYGTTWNEAQTEDELIKPILNILDWKYTVQVKSVKKGQVKRPDYALFGDDNAKNAAYPHQGNDDAFYSHALAIAEAKHWDRPLSEKDSSGRATWKSDSNPSHQMVSYLVGTRSPWGILTNGRTWRLYSREVSSTASEYYEIDLGLLFDFLPQGVTPSEIQVEQFKRWWLFFRKQSFIPTLSGKSFVQRVHEGSTTYAREISDKLKDLVFEQVMPEIAGGFIAYRFNEMGKQEETAESLVEIYRASLSLLYKILFLLYAEARGLLPMENAGYRQESMTELARWASEQIDRQLPLSNATYATPRYSSLLALFRRIDKGDVSLGIPQYNGGLFSQKNPDNQFLMQHRLSDRAVAHMIDYLAREGGQPVDYAYISVRNLGAIYEGLLENKLNILDAAAGKVELINDKGERKASGSYYTPDYIVDYIVQNTLDPILNERQVVFEKAMEKVASLRRQLEKAIDSALNRHLQRELADSEREAREAFLGIKVLDPAMGSGHFLVNAVDHLTDGIIQRIEEFHGTNQEIPREWNPIQKLIEQVRNTVIAEMQNKGLAIDFHRLDDTALLTRLVMKRCIYGVDLNQMAVELAKVSLWLHSFTVGAPLSFLDHHLRWGNSLVGVWDFEKYIAKGSDRWNDVLRTLTAMVEISEMTDGTVGEVAESSRLYSESRTWIQSTINRLNTELAASFFEWGKNKKLVAQVTQLSYKDENSRNSSSSGLVEKYESALHVANLKGFFNWKLEFPEVFIDIKTGDWSKKPGFDAIVGNPPYGATFDIEKDFIKENYLVHQMDYDSYIFFEEKAIHLLAKGGFHSFIMPNMWFTLEKNETLRRFILASCENQVLTDTGRVFEEASVETGITVCRKVYDIFSKQSLVEAKPIQSVCSVRLLPYEVSISERLDLIAREMWEAVYNRDQTDWWENIFARFDYYISDSESNVIKKVKGQSVPLSQYAEISQGLTAYDKYRGHTPEMIKGRVFHSSFQKDQTYQRFLQGDDVKRYSIDWSGEWISYGDWLAAPRDPKFFTKPRIIVREVTGGANRPLATFTNDEYYYGHSVIPAVLTDDEVNGLYVTAVVNSCLLGWYNLRTSPNARKNLFPKINPSDVASFPIRKIDFSTPKQRRVECVDQLQKMSEEFLKRFDSSSLLVQVKKHLSLEKSETDIVHDLLAYLAEKMIRLNLECKVEGDKFLSWLQIQLGVSLDSLTGKNQLRNYFGDYQKSESAVSFQELLEILRKNQKKIKSNINSRAFIEQLENEYKLSLDILLPLTTKLKLTNELIDNIVFILYGLTNEEIIIVKSSFM